MNEAPEFTELPPAIQGQIAVFGPLLVGMIAGFLLNESETGWIVIQVLAAVGGIAGGFDHRGARAGALRGVIGGVLFGTGVVLADAIAGDDRLSNVPHPIGVLIVVTTIAGTLLGALGGWLRSRARSSAPVT